MAFPLTPTQISVALSTPLANTTANWPIIEAALNERGICSDLVCIAAIATVKVECPPFKPVHEYGDVDYFTKHYENRADLGNTQPGDGARFAGRGFIQITGRSNYRNYGKALGIDLESHPDYALTPTAAADILAIYFKDHGIDKAAEAQDWVRVRKLVNGGTNGLKLFEQAEQTLQGQEAAQAPSPAPAAPVLQAVEDTNTQYHLNIVETLLRLIRG